MKKYEWASLKMHDDEVKLLWSIYCHTNKKKIVSIINDSKGKGIINDPKGKRMCILDILELGTFIVTILH